MDLTPLSSNRTGGGREAGAAGGPKEEEAEAKWMALLHDGRQGRWGKWSAKSNVHLCAFIYAKNISAFAVKFI